MTAHCRPPAGRQWRSAGCPARPFLPQWSTSACRSCQVGGTGCVALVSESATGWSMQSPCRRSSTRPGSTAAGGNAYYRQITFSSAGEQIISASINGQPLHRGISQLRWGRVHWCACAEQLQLPANRAHSLGTPYICCCCCCCRVQVGVGRPWAAAQHLCAAGRPADVYQRCHPGGPPFCSEGGPAAAWGAVCVTSGCGRWAQARQLLPP